MTIKEKAIRARLERKGVIKSVTAKTPVDHKVINLINDFATDLIDHITAIEKKHGDGTLDYLKSKLILGDPLDVASYCAFAWLKGYAVDVQEVQDAR